MFDFRTLVAICSCVFPAWAAIKLPAKLAISDIRHPSVVQAHYPAGVNEMLEDCENSRHNQETNRVPREGITGVPSSRERIFPKRSLPGRPTATAPTAS